MKTCVIIPTYNETKQIGRVVKEVSAQGLDVLVVDDGSTDNTVAIAKENGATVLRNPNNQGKGASLLKGFNYCLQHNYDAVVTMDGDGQHLPEDLPYFMRIAKYSNSDIFIGNRMQKTKDMPLARFLTNKIMSSFISLLAKQKIPDTQCGFRLIKRRVLENINITTSKYETESEILIKSARLGYKIESIPIKTVYSGEKSQINPTVDTFRFMRYIIKEIWTSLS